MNGKNSNIFFWTIYGVFYNNVPVIYHFDITYNLPEKYQIVYIFTVLSLEIQLLRLGGSVPFTGLTTPLFWICPKP